MIAFEKSVGAVVFRRTPEGPLFLILDHGNNYWNFPKGHSMPGETETETLIRETHEETGISDLKISSGFRIKNYWFYRAKGEEKKRRLEKNKKINVLKIGIYYLAETQTPEIKLSHEHIGYKWLGFQEALKTLTYRISRKSLKKAMGCIEDILDIK